MRSALFAFAVALSVATPSMADGKVAVVDLQRALNEVEEGASAKAALKKEFDAKQKQLDQRQTELKGMKD